MVNQDMDLSVPEEGGQNVNMPEQDMDLSVHDEGGQNVNMPDQDVDLSVHDLDFSDRLQDFYSPEYWDRNSEMTEDLLWDGCDWPEGSEYAGLGSEGPMEWPEEADLN